MSFTSALATRGLRSLLPVLSGANSWNLLQNASYSTGRRNGPYATQRAFSSISSDEVDAVNKELDSFFGVTGGVPEARLPGTTSPFEEIAAEQLGSNLHKDPAAELPSVSPHVHPWSTTQPHLFQPAAYPSSVLPSSTPLPAAEAFAADEALSTDLVAATAHGAHSFSPEDSTTSSTRRPTATPSSSSSPGFEWPPPGLPREQPPQAPYTGPSGPQQHLERVMHEIMLLRQELLEQGEQCKRLQVLNKEIEDLKSQISLLTSSSRSSSNSRGGGSSNSFQQQQMISSLKSSSSCHRQQQAGLHPVPSGQHQAGVTAAEAGQATTTTSSSSSSSTIAAGSTLTHVDSSGAASMVDVSSKGHSKRVATASCRVRLGPRAFALVQSNQMAKGDVLRVAQLAGIMGAKQTSNLIPLCHNIFLSKVDVQLDLEPESHAVLIRATAVTVGQTGVEMEALTAAGVAGLVVYDMCKAVSKDIILTDLQLDYKEGGKSGTYMR